MSAFLTPADESGRLRTLENLRILDTLPEAFSDAIACAAAAIADVPMSAVSLIDSERQWFKASCGLDAAQTSRDVSFCAHTILDARPLIVDDAQTDPRFANNALVVGSPSIRFYAGFPLMVNGHAVGALCVIDRRPRELTRTAIEQLVTLAAGASEWMQDRQALAGSLIGVKDELRYAVQHDGLTGLPNARLFADQLTQSAAEADDGATGLAVLSIHVQGLKAYRNGWGDDCADFALREIARRLGNLVRPGDMVARFSGEHFVMSMCSGQSQDAAMNRLEQVRLALDAPIRFERCEMRLGVAAGIALYPEHGPAHLLLSHAVAAGEEANERNVGAHLMFDAAAHSAARERTAMVEDLRHAAGRHEFELHYQPKLHAKTGQLTGTEALLRWHRPGHGVVGPAIFISLAEQHGLMKEIGRWIMVEACRQMRIWREAGLEIRVAINLSVQQLRQPTLAAELAVLLEHHGIAAHLLICEVTESVAMDDAVAAIDVFGQLRAVGVQLSIDDFGTGYSSLSYLRRLPVHQLKIDRSFVTDLPESEDARVIAAGIINLAHSLRLEVVAEGVETQAQRETLAGMGCDEFQGYLFGRPMTAESLFTWMERRDADYVKFRKKVLS